MVEFTTVTDYQQTFEICLNDIWQHYISEQEKAFNEPFDDEEKDINKYSDELLKEIVSKFDVTLATAYLYTHNFKFKKKY